jgi:hypothetical protein
MKKLYFPAFLIGFLILAVPAFSVDVRWTSSITISPAVLTTGVSASATATFRVDGAGGIDNLRVTGGVVGGDTMFDRTWAHINDATTRTATFSGTPGDPGTFTIYFQIDPDSTSPDSDRTNNRVELTISVAAGALPNLVNIVPGPTWTPAVFAAGETLTIHYMLANIGEASAHSSLVGLRVNGVMVAQNPVPEMAAGGPFHEGNFTWPVVCGADVALVVDSGNDISESNETDNLVPIPGLSTCAAAPVPPNLTVEKIVLLSGGTTVGEHTATYYQGKIWSRENSSTNVKVRAGIVGGAVLFEKTYPIIIKNDGRFVKFKANLPKGIITLYIEVDPDNTITESNEGDNRATSKFQVIGKEGPMIAPATLRK